MKNAARILFILTLTTLTSTAQAGKGKSFPSTGRSFSGGKSVSGRSFSPAKSSAGQKTLAGAKSFSSSLNAQSFSRSPNFNTISGGTRILGNNALNPRFAPNGNVGRPGIATLPKLGSNFNPKPLGGPTNAVSTVQRPLSNPLKAPGVSRPNFSTQQLDGDRIKSVIGDVVGKPIGEHPRAVPKFDPPLGKDRPATAIQDVVGGGSIGQSVRNDGGHENENGDKHRHRHPLQQLRRRICLPPIVRCPPPRVCPPSVLAVCPGAEVVVVERTTEQVLVEFFEEPTAPAAPAFVLDLESNAEVSLEIDGLTDTPGAIVLEINGIGLPVEILMFADGVLDVRAPSVGLAESQLGKLYVLNHDLQLVAAVDARLHPGTEAR